MTKNTKEKTYDVLTIGGDGENPGRQILTLKESQAYAEKHSLKRFFSSYDD